MVQKFRENVEIGNKVNFRDKIFMITEKNVMILRPLVISLLLLSQHDQIPSRREIPHMEIQSCIRGFHVYKEV